MNREELINRKNALTQNQLINKQNLEQTKKNLAVFRSNDKIMQGAIEDCIYWLSQFDKVEEPKTVPTKSVLEISDAQVNENN